MGDLKIDLKVTMHRNYGITDVEFEAVSRDVPVDGSLITNDLLVASMLRWFNHFEENTLKEVKGAKLKQNIEERTVNATQLTVGMKDGKRLYTVLCGDWMKHGVPFYEEHMKAAGINPKEIPDDGLTFADGTKVVVQLVDGSVKRVMGFANRP